MSIVAGLVGASWTKFNSTRVPCEDYETWCDFDRVYYLSINSGKEKESEFPFFVKLGTWFLIVLNIIPISLMVTKEMVSFI
jgi:hypothetical protein